MEKNDKMAIFVLSCDKYSDVWDEFFNLVDKFWKDCNFQWYLITESKKYNREGIITITGKGDWSTRYRHAVQSVDCPYICSFLDDYFITKTVDTLVVNKLVDQIQKESISYVCLDDGFDHIQKSQSLQSYDDNLYYIPKHLPYGVDTAGAIWDRNYLLEKLGQGDYSAWQFELDRCNEAKSEVGLSGLILLDKRQLLNISKIPVIIQGAYYPPAIKYFNKLGYNINCHNRHIMSMYDVFKYNLKVKCSRIKHGRRFMKWVGHYVFGYNFVSKD